MPLFKSSEDKKKGKGRKGKKAAEDEAAAEEEGAAAAAAAEEDDQTPKRPGSSGTANLLASSRKDAMEQYAKAQRAERAYQTKRHSEWAHALLADTKSHYAQTFSHLGKAIKGTFSVLSTLPYLVGEKREGRRRAAEARKRERHLEQKKKLEEALAKAEAEGGEEKPAE